ncbi:hypothetical protein BDA99DRAFT_4987 [Phascolomyces articulosus]|uniref:Uncharacterized protein n=1 Tax=Phascolomyces articulosus TaxID=60185 RepID=A0AAD5PKI9_9FUNG|nr:hypothetical protein BDA99DRAFT_4987 [Phascolomyces articulosus]
MIQIMDILDVVIASIQTPNSQSEIHTKTIKSETTYYRRFAAILDILFRDTLFDISDGEQTSQITKEIMARNSKAFSSAKYSESVIGRRIDLMIRSSGIELSTSEWKRKGAVKGAGRRQQIKNVRGNKSILKYLLSLPVMDSDRQKVFCLGLDFIGKIFMFYSVTI